MTIDDQPFADVMTVRGTNGNDAFVSVTIDLDAGKRPTCFEEVCKGKSGNLAASVLLAGRIKANLPALWRIDPIEPDALAMDIDGVGIDYGCAAYNRLRMSRQ